MALWISTSMFRHPRRKPHLRDFPDNCLVIRNARPSSTSNSNHSARAVPITDQRLEPSYFTLAYPNPNMALIRRTSRVSPASKSTTYLR